MRIVAVLMLFLALSVAARAQETRVFGDWTATCDPSGYCSATASDSPDYTFSIARHAKQSYWELRLRATGASIPRVDQGMVVTVDGEVSVFEPTTGIGAYGDDRSFYLLGGSAQELMDRINPGTAPWLSFLAPDSNRPPFSSFSLKGLPAALIWIDEQQGRLGSERVAEAAPYGLVPVDPGDSAAPDIPLALLDRHRADPECTPFEELENGRDFVVDPFMEGYALYILPCWSARYNFGSKVYLELNGHFIPQYFASYSGEARGWAGTPFIVNYSYDRQTRTLSEFNKARNLADCGSAATWTWYISMLRLEEYRYKECEDGPLEENAEVPEFPVVYIAPRLPPVQ